jgi:hypothetical protein
LSNQKILRKRPFSRLVMSHSATTAYCHILTLVLVAQGAIPRRDDLRRFGSKMQIPGLQSIHNP